MTTPRAWEGEEADRNGPPAGRWLTVFALFLSGALVVQSWPLLGRGPTLTAVSLLAAAAPLVAALGLRRFMPGLSRRDGYFVLAAVLGIATGATLLAADLQGRLPELSHVRKDHPRRAYSALAIVPLAIGGLLLVRWGARLDERRRNGAKRNARPEPPPLPARLAIGLLGAPLAAAVLIGTAEATRWVRLTSFGDHVLIGFWYYGSSILLPYMLQRQIVRQAAARPGRTFWVEALADYAGTLTGCVALFTYFARAQFLASPGYYAGADPALGTWLTYCLNSFFDAVLLGAPSMFGFEISAVAPRTFSARMMLYVFRLLTVAALLQTLGMIVKVRSGAPVKLEELGPIARHLPE